MLVLGGEAVSLGMYFISFLATRVDDREVRDGSTDIDRGEVPCRARRAAAAAQGSSDVHERWCRTRTVRVLPFHFVRS